MHFAYWKKDDSLHVVAPTEGRHLCCHQQLLRGTSLCSLTSSLQRQHNIYMLQKYKYKARNNQKFNHGYRSERRNFTSKKSLYITKLMYSDNERRGKLLIFTRIFTPFPIATNNKKYYIVFVLQSLHLSLACACGLIFYFVAFLVYRRFGSATVLTSTRQCLHNGHC